MSTNIELARMAVSGLSKTDRAAFIRELTGACGKPADHTAPKTLRPKQAAARHGVSKRLLCKLSREGLLHPVRLPGRVRGCGFRVDELDQVFGSAQ